MNVYDILRRLGYDVHSFNEDGVYTVCFSPERIRRYKKLIEAGEMGFDGDLYGIWHIKVSEVSFNGFGNLFVSFVDADNSDNCLDSFEYGNMEPDELY